MLLLSIMPTEAERPSGEGALNGSENPDIRIQREGVLTKNLLAIAMRCNRLRIARLKLHFRALSGTRRLHSFSAQSPLHHHCDETSSSGPEPPSAAKHSHGCSGCYLVPAIPARSLDGLPV